MKNTKYRIREKGCTTVVSAMGKPVVEWFTGFKDKFGVSIFDGDTLTERVEVDGEMIDAKYPVFFHDELNLWCIDTSYKKDRSHFDMMHELDLSGLAVLQPLNDPT